MDHRRISADGNRPSGSAWIGHRLEPLVWHSNHGRIYQRQMEYFPWIRGSGYSNYPKLQVNY